MREEEEKGSKRRGKHCTKSCRLVLYADDVKTNGPDRTSTNRRKVAFFAVVFIFIF